ncbi:MFS transporter [Bacillus massilinigeriensis]|uniref:MFS transporter n=1 Tax=Bacillus massilionigeriensis TaxID=1805475 RepID=UPI00096B21E3|nr:MFS transporter [Bacillus massilionigeriensis]
MATVISNIKGQVVKNRAFSILLTGNFLLSIGNKIYEIVLPLMIYELTRSSIAMGSMRTAELLPNFFFAIFIGVLVDRFKKKKWVLWMIGSQSVLLLILFILFKSGSNLLPLYYFLGFLLMTVNYGYFNAQMSLTKLVVPTNMLTSANAKFSFAETFVGIMGPALTGLILMMAHIYYGIIITAFLYLFCFFLFARLNVDENIKGTDKKSFLLELKEGWLAFQSNRLLRLMTIFVVFLNSTMIVINTSVIFLAKDEWNISSTSLALVLATAGIGGLLASTIISWLRIKIRLGVLFGMSMIINALSYIGMATANHVSILLIALFINGMAATVYTVCAYTFRHEQTPAHLMGRINGITGTLFRIGMPISTFLAGYMMDWWGTISVFLSAAILNIFIFLIYLKTTLWKIS